MEEVVPAPASPPVPLWRNGDYLLFWSGQVISVVGTIAAGIAFPLLVLALSHSPLQAGIVGALERLPFLVLALPAGALMDRWNRKRVMIICDSARTLAFATIPLAVATGHLTVALVYAVSLAEGFGFAFYNLASVAALPQIVDKSQITRAAAQNNVMYAVGSTAGPPLGGLLYAAGRSLPFLANAVSYGLSVISLLFIRREFQGERAETPASLWTEVKEGLSWLWNHRLIRFLAFLTSATNLAFGGLPLAVIVLAQRDFHASSSAIGIVFGFAALGAIVGSLAAGEVVRRLTLAQSILAGLWLSALFLPLLAAGSSLIMVGVIASGLLLVSPIYDVAQFSYRLQRIPDEMQARINSIYRMILFAGEPLGQAITGALLQFVSPRGTILIMGGTMVVASGVASLNRDLRREGKTR